MYTVESNSLGYVILHFDPVSNRDRSLTMTERHSRRFPFSQDANGLKVRNFKVNTKFI